MSELHRQLTQNFANAYDRYEAHMRNADPMSLEDIKEVTPLTMEMMLAQWAASLDIKTKHDLMRTSISGIK